MKLVIDIQTVAAPGVEDSFYPSWAMKRGSKTPEEAMSRAGMHPEFGFICGVAVLPVDDNGEYEEENIKVKIATSLEEEDALLGWLLETVHKLKPESLVGHNIKNFDVPYLTKRYLARGYCIPDFLKNAMAGNITDVMQILACGGGTMMSLRASAYMLGIEDPASEDGPQNVYNLFTDGRLSDIADLAKINVQVTADVHKALLDGQLI